MALRRQRQSQRDPFRPLYLDLDRLLAEGEKYLVDGGPHRADIIAGLCQHGKIHMNSAWGTQCATIRGRHRVPQLREC